MTFCGLGLGVAVGFVGGRIDLKAEGIVQEYGMGKEIVVASEDERKGVIEMARATESS